MALGTLAAIVGITPAVAAGGVLPSPAVIQQRDPSSVVSADALPTIQLDSGYVWAQTTIGTTVFAAGSFSNARQAGTAAGAGVLTPRSNILAYDIRTGALLPFAPQVNGVIKAVAASPDGSRIYIGGSFNSVNGQPRFNVAALDASTGALVPGFGASIGGTGVYALTATSDVLYVGGLFTQGGGVARKNLAAFSTAAGALLGWAPTTDLQTDAMVLDPSKQKLIVGGRFAKVNDVAQRGLAALDLSSGAIVAWAAPATIQNGISTGGNAGKAGIFALTADSGAVYGTGWSFAGAAAGNLEGTFAAEAGSGSIRWVADCHGDHYGVYSTGSVVYTTSHVHACETLGEFPDSVKTHKYAEAYTADARGILTRTAQAGGSYKDWSGTPSPAPYNWYPDFTVGTSSGLGQAGLSVTGSGGYISIGGEFGSVNNRQFQGLVRFAVTPTGQGRMGPRLSGADWVGSAASPSGGTVQVSIPANWDRDDLNLTYDLYREGVASPVDSVVARSTWWDRPLVGLTETGLHGGSTPRYRVVVRDADGNQVSTDWSSVTVSGATRSAYADSVLLDGANSYWRLGADRSNAAGGLAPRIGSGVVAASSGALASDGAASTFDGTSSGTIGGGATTAVMSGAFSIESWVKTSSTRGGEIAGFGTAASGSSTSNDRVLYLQSNGRVTFGMVNGAARTVATGPAVNDGRWHHVVGVVSNEGMSLYVDGSLAAQDTSVVAARLLSGYWRAGGDNLSGWPGRPASDYLSGQLDEVAAYPTALTAAQVAQHAAVASGAVPVASFTSATSDLTVSTDASSSRAAQGRSITAYAWTFGDGGTASGVRASHAYAGSGSYPVTLTVTDSAGATATSTSTITVTAANRAPTASFSAAGDGLSVSVDGSASTDPDGSVVAYDWTFGDGGSATGRTASHAYAAAGTYSVGLTVTDDRGARASSTRTVSVAALSVIASDDFERTTSGGWGSADAGGAWSILAGSATAASVSGGAGTLTLAPGGTRYATVPISARDTTSTVRFSVDADAATGTAYAGIVARQMANLDDDYTVRAWLRPDGTVWLVAQRGATVIGSAAVSGITRAAGDAFEMRATVSGASPTTITATLWRAGSAEPAGSQLTVTDATAAVQGAGSAGLYGYRSGSATSTANVRFDDFSVTRIG